MSAPEFPYSEQLREVRRELAYRDRVYARRVSEGKLSQRSADHHMALMRAVAETLRPLADAEEAQARANAPELQL